MKKQPIQTFFSIRTVRARDVDSAITKVEDNEFDENHSVCDKVLPLLGIIEQLFPNAHILTDEQGEILGVYTGTSKQIKEKVRATLTFIYGEIRLRNFSLGLFEAISGNLEKHKEFYLTAVSIT